MTAKQDTPKRSESLARILGESEPPAHVRERLLARVMTSAALAPQVPDAPPSLPRIPVSTAKSLALVALGATGGVLGVRVYDHAVAKPDAVAQPTLQAPALLEPPTLLSPEAPKTPDLPKPPEPVAKPSASSRSRVVDKAPEPSEEDVSARERNLIEQARAAILRQNPKAAFLALAEHERQFASGTFVEERQALTIEALMLDGRREEAAMRLGQFRQRFPKSFLTPMLERSFLPRP